MTSAPEVSIVIATRNRWTLLSTHGLPSALGQEGVELEVIVVDDCSTDETAARLAELDDPRVRVVRHESRRGLAGAHNTGVAEAGGEWLAFLDDDDLWSPRKLRTQLDAAAQENVDWVYSAAVVVDDHKRVLAADPFPDPSELPRLLLQGNFVPGGGSNVIARADVVRRVGGFDESLVRFSDWDLWIRLAEAGQPAATPAVAVARVEHGQNMVIRDRAHALQSYTRLLSKHRQVTRRDRLSIAEWTAYEHHRAGYRILASWLYLRAALRYGSLGNLPPALGALFGEPGMRLASRLLIALRGGSHIAPEVQAAPPDPAWLSSYR
jgi:glycosyltransferase involved in cell wall biosynthesis